MDVLELVRAIAPALAAFIAVLLTRRSEAAKLDTRLEKLDQIEIEIQRVTRAQEKIKQEVGSQEWKRQWKREAYVGFLSAVQNFATHVNMLKFQFETAKETRDLSLFPELKEQIGRLYSDFYKAVLDSYSLCRLVAT